MDFRALNARILHYLADSLKKDTRDEAHRDAGGNRVVEEDVYMRQDKDPQSGRTFIRCACAFEFQQRSARIAFIKQALASQEYRFFRLIFSSALALPKFDIDATLINVRDNSRHRANKIADEFTAMICFGELIDVTRNINEVINVGMAAASN